MTLYQLTQTFYIYSIPMLFALFICLLEIALVFRGYSLLCILNTLPTKGHFLRTSAGKAAASVLGVYEISPICWILIFFMSFSVTGLLAQQTFYFYTERFLPDSGLFPVTLLVSLLVTKMVIDLLTAKLKSRNQHADPEDFTGYIATIESFSEFLGDKMNASLTDHNGLYKTVTVIALEKNQRFLSGDKVVLVKNQDGNWLASRCHPISPDIQVTPISP
ncbi:OB-fold-containig protein [Alteromonas lipolytica]|uniref:Inner membrane protein YqiJ N-terminal domain-containing protein n=1 Tax=Alteromonas lipolytica TaxID=1856405 RepID=A0A1E8FFP2_9ALTE|nr:OB-fold-containig protein [Alteromonas lipolytica]OFI34777.1 hypothetical protein BFC17_14450 [Alteromonas lipolytica]GGF53912.1 hypothetical protein GCM10011338_02580 [Alteromonas lipolytica]